MVDSLLLLVVVVVGCERCLALSRVVKFMARNNLLATSERSHNFQEVFTQTITTLHGFAAQTMTTLHGFAEVDGSVLRSLL